MKQKIIIISGGTIVPIRPHLALSAPAYGTIGKQLEEAFKVKFPEYNIILAETKMARKNSPIETNDQLSHFVDNILEETDLAGIVMAAAICDFVPHHADIDGWKHDIWEGETRTVQFGEEFPRLSSKQNVSLNLVPSEKIINKIKQKRPDIKLITFKTTANETLTDLIKKSEDNFNRSRSDIVFGNDIKQKLNIFVHKMDGGMHVHNYETRDQAITGLVSCFKLKLEAD